MMAMPDVNKKSLLARNPDLVAAVMDGDIVMMSIERGLYFGISGVGTRIWALLEIPMSVEDLVRIIRSEYEIDEVTCQTDLLAFAQDLVGNGIVQIAE